MYILGEPPRTPNEAFDALDNVFGAEEFSAGDAGEVLEEVLEMRSDEARNELQRLVRMNTIEEV